MMKKKIIITIAEDVEEKDHVIKKNHVIGNATENVEIQQMKWKFLEMDQVVVMMIQMMY